MFFLASVVRVSSVSLVVFSVGLQRRATLNNDATRYSGPAVGGATSSFLPC